jgi:hypothetical protein
MFEHPAYRRVTAFMVSYGTFFLGTDDLAPAFQPSHNTVNGIQKILFLYGLLVLSGSNQGGFITNIGNIGS